MNSMERSEQGLNVEDVAAVIRLMGEISDPDRPEVGDLNAQRRRLFDGLAGLIGAPAWTWIHGRRNPQGDRIMVFASLDHFQSEQQRRHAMHMVIDDKARTHIDRSVNALFNEANTLPAARGHFTRNRDQLVDDATWYESAMYRTDYLPAGLEDFLLSIYPLGTHVWSGSVFFRGAGQRPFGPRELALVHLVLNNVDWLHREGSDVPANSSELVDLSVRAREVLFYLVKGDSAKQIGRKLHLSVHTVQDHIKTIYRRFNVSSRGELLARFIASRS